MGIYNNIFRFLFTWVIPIGFVAFYPCQYFLGSKSPDWTVWATPLMGGALFWLAVKVWNAGVRRWGGTGS